MNSMITHLTDQLIPIKDRNSFELGLYLQALNELKPTKYTSSSGDCLEINFSPEILRQHTRDRLTIRRTAINRWRIWKIIL